MPKTRQKSRWTGGKKPARTPTKKQQPEFKTVEQLQAEIVAKVDLAEALMMKHPRPPFRLNQPSGYPPLEEALNGFDKLLWELEKRMSPEGLRMDEDSKVEAWFEQTFSDADGTAPRWSRRGRFILFLDYLPILVTWSGIMKPDMTAVAVDPAQPFIRNPQVTGRQLHGARRLLL